MPARAVVLGASGFIGTRLVAHLSRQGCEVCAIDIAPPRACVPNVQYVQADVRQPLNVPMTQVDALYNLAAVHRTPGHDPHEYYDANVHGALNAVAFAESANINTVVFTSSISVYGPCEELVVEDSPLNPVSDYGKSKRMAEVIHRQWAERKGGRQLVIVRPGVVFGPGERGNYTHLAGALKRGIFFYPGRRDTIKSGGHVDELILTLEFALSRHEPSITYNFAYPDASTTEDIVQTFADVAGFSSHVVVLPRSLLYAAATGFEIANRLGAKNPIHRERITKLVQSTRISPRWLLDNGYVFASDLKSALASWRAETNNAFV